MGYGYLVTEIIVCLLAAAALGGGIIWWLMRQKQTDWETQLQSLRQQLDVSSGQLATTTKNLTAEAKKVTELTAGLAAAVTKRSELETAIAGNEKLLQDWAVKYASLEADLKVRSASLSAAHADTEALRQRLTAVEVNVRGKDEALQSRGNEMENLRVQLAVRLANVKGLEVRLGELSTYPDKLKDQEAKVVLVTSQLDAAVTKSTAELAAVNARLKSLEEQLREADKERDSFSAKSSERAGEIARLRGQLADTEKRMASLTIAPPAIANDSLVASLKTQVSGLQNRLVDDECRYQAILKAREELITAMQGKSTTEEHARGQSA